VIRDTGKVATISFRGGFDRQFALQAKSLVSADAVKGGAANLRWRKAGRQSEMLKGASQLPPATKT
jgi:hypothetical protein